MSVDVVLSVNEASLLSDCETTVARGLATFVEVGRALATIRDGRLYRAEFGTFEEYCDQRWALSARYANQLIGAAQVVETISGAVAPEINSDPPLLPATERQARELAPLLDDPEELQEVWTETVQRTSGRPTASAIRAVRQEREEVIVEPIPASPVSPAAPHRRPILDAFRDATLDTVKDVDRLCRLLADGRWTRNATKVAPSLRNDLREALDRLSAVVAELSNQQQGV